MRVYLETGGTGKETNCDEDEHNLDFDVHDDEVCSLN